MFSLAFSLLGLAIAAWVGFTFYMQYRAATGTWFARTLTASKGSATIAWQKLGLVTGGLILSLDKVADWVAQLLGDQTAADTIKGYIQAGLKPQYVGGALVLFAAVGVWARLRTLKV